MKLSRTMSGLAGAVALSCLLGLAPQQAGATVVLDCGDASSTFGTSCSVAELAAGSMTVSGTTFSNFGVFPGLALDLNAIRVNPIDAPYNPGFTLMADTAVGIGNLDENLVFNVAMDPGSFLRIKDASLAVAIGNFTGVSAGLISVFEDLGLTVLAGSCDVGAPGCANSMLTDSAQFSPVSALTDVLLGVSVNTDGEVQINSVTMQFSQVPEPGSLALLTLGLAGLGVSSHRRRRLAA